jgi:purine catabolism regulator
VAAGVGAPRARATDLPRAWDEARFALEATAAVRRGGRIGTPGDLGSLQLVLSLQDARGVELFCDAVLGPLERHDRRHRAQLCASLEAYLEANGRWAEAAAQLGVHRHTLRYRVQRIEQLTGRDLDSGRDRLELWLALRARELDVVRTPSSSAPAAAPWRGAARAPAG